MGIAGLTDKGGNAACSTSSDAANAATLAYYSNTGGNYPQTFTNLTSAPSGEPLLDTDAATITSPTHFAGQGRMDLDHASGSNDH